MNGKTKLFAAALLAANVVGLAGCTPDEDTTAVTNPPVSDEADECPRADGEPCK